VKLTCDRTELAEAVGFATTVVPTRSTRQILQDVRIQAEGGVVEVLATDLEVGVRVRVEKADVARDGAGLFPAGKTTSVLRELAGDKVEVGNEDGVSIVDGDGSQFRFAVEDAGEFPAVPRFQDGPDDAFSLDRAALERLIRKTAFAAATEGTRYALNGVLFDIQDGRLRLVATDGKRLAKVDRPLADPGAPGKVYAVVPTKGVMALARLASSDEETVKLRFLPGQLHAAGERASLSAQLVQGRFPPYEEVIPRGHEKRVFFDTGVLLAGLRRAALVTTKDSQGVKLSFAYNKLTLASRAPELGEAKVELPVEYPYDPLEATFNPQLLVDALKAIDAGTVKIELKESTTAALLEEEGGLLYVVMPINQA